MASSSATTLQPKPCITCARQITPRAKWEKDWPSIKTCSDSCKAFKPGAKPTKWMLRCSGERLDAAVKHDSLLAQCLTFKEAEEGGREGLLNVDVEAWLELILLDSAPAPSHDGKKLPCDDDAARRLAESAQRFDDEALATEDASTTTTLSKHVSEAGPGLRERVRRACRRLFILPPDLWACRAYLDVESSQSEHNGGLDLLQNGKVLNGLEGASFAKGPIYFRRRRAIQS